MGKDDLKIISRSEWGAQPPKSGIEKQIYVTPLPNVLENIVIHHTAFADRYSPAEVQRYALTTGWDDFAYHYYITGDGKVYEGRELKYIGGHAGQSVEANRDHDLKKDPDYGSIGIALGGAFFAKTDRATEPQIESLRKLIVLLEGRFPKITADHILLHREVDDKITRPRGFTPYRAGNESTTCPGEGIVVQIDELRNKTLRAVPSKKIRRADPKK